MAGPVASLVKISKRFGQTQALRGVDLQLEAGQVHVLAGGNGAGKSTLIRILAGAITDYGGSLLLDGERRRFAGPADATRAGIATIHQELSLVGPMSVADNLFLGEQLGLFSRARRAEHRHKARELLERLELDIDVDTPVEALPLGTRQLLEIARALAGDARLLVMDEPTSALNEAEVERLFAQVAALREQGKAIVFITHRMEEIYRLADRISVLRDGQLVASGSPESLDEPALLTAMLGERPQTDPSPDEALAPTATTSADELLRIEALRVPSGAGADRWVVDDVSLTLQQREIVGVAGLEGSGDRDLLYALFGARREVQGRVRLGGEATLPADPAEAVRRGVVLLAGDRGLSVLEGLGVTDNCGLSSLQRYRPGPPLSWLGWVDTRRQHEAADEVTSSLRLQAPGLDAPAWQLSGGNQQKVAMARCLLAQPQVLLLDDPTRGVDVAARRDVHERVGELARSGVGVLVASSEMDELVQLCQRVLVLVAGRVVAELSGAELSRRRLLEAAMGSHLEAS